MPQSTTPTRSDWIKSFLYITIYLIIIGAGAFLLLPDFWYIWLIILLLGMAILVNWHKKETAYRCPKCEHEYTISFLADLAAPHGVDREGAWLLLKCPNCKERCKTRVLKRVK